MHVHREVLAWPLCGTHVCEFHLERGGILLLHHGCVHWVSHERREYSVSTTTALSQPGERLCCVMLWYTAMVAMPARREYMCLQFLWLLESPSSLLACTLPTLGSANSVDSVNSETTGVMNRISDPFLH